MYFPTSTVTALTPAFSTTWDITAQALRRQTSTVKQNTAIVAGQSVSETLTTVVDVLDRQYVSAQQIPSARTIGTGSVSAVIRIVESNAAANGMLQLVIRVVSADGTVERGVLHAGATQTSVVATVGAQNEEIGTTASTRIWNGIQLSSVACQANDRIVIEIGWRATNTVSTSYTTTRTWGDPTATADYALTSGLTTSLCPWVEFTEDLFTHDAGASLSGVGSLTVGAVVSKTAAASMTGVSSLTAGATVEANVVQAAATLAGTGSLTAGASQVHVGGAVSMAGQGHLVVGGVVIKSAAVAFSATADMTVAGVRGLVGTVVMSVNGTLTVGATLAHAAAVVLVGTGVLVAGVSSGQGMAVSMAGVGSLIATAHLTITHPPDEGVTFYIGGASIELLPDITPYAGDQ